MFSKHFRRFHRTLTFRLTVNYAIFFGVSVAFTLFLIDAGFRTLLHKQDQRFIRGEMREFAADYREGLSHLYKEVGGKHSSISVLRIADGQNRTLAFFAPDPSCREALGSLEVGPISVSNSWRKLSLVTGTLEIGVQPLHDGNFLQAGLSSRRSELLIRHVELLGLAVALPTLLIAAVAGAFLANRTLSPVRELSKAVKSTIATGRTDARLQPTLDVGELSDLVESFNEMLVRNEALFESLKGTLDNVAHDLRTPVSRLQGMAEFALRGDLDVEVLRDALADCVEESARLMTLLNTIMDITEAGVGAMRLDPSPVSLASVAAEIAELYRDVADKKQIVITAEVGFDLTVLADLNRIRQAVANLVDNAIKYTPSGGRIRIVISKCANQSVLSVEDTGIGIAIEEQLHVWERLYRSDRSRSERGLGLGLSLVHAIMQAHHGRAELHSSLGGGSVFRLCFSDANH